MKYIIINEWKNLIRDRLFSYSTIFFVLSLSLVVWMGILQQENQQQSQYDAQKHVRKQWENLEAMNPHRAAHYGSFAFKPLNILNAMDGGINDITGKYYSLKVMCKMKSFILRLLKLCLSRNLANLNLR